MMDFLGGFGRSKGGLMMEVFHQPAISPGDIFTPVDVLLLKASLADGEGR